MEGNWKAFPCCITSSIKEPEHHQWDDLSCHNLYGESLGPVGPLGRHIRFQNVPWEPGTVAVTIIPATLEAETRRSLKPSSGSAWAAQWDPVS
jgi:hypothetical protein